MPGLPSGVDGPLIRFTCLPPYNPIRIRYQDSIVRERRLVYQLEYQCAGASEEDPLPSKPFLRAVRISTANGYKGSTPEVRSRSRESLLTAQPRHCRTLWRMSLHPTDRWCIAAAAA